MITAKQAALAALILAAAIGFYSIVTPADPDGGQGAISEESATQHSTRENNPTVSEPKTHYFFENGIDNIPELIKAYGLQDTDDKIVILPDFQGDDNETFYNFDLAVKNDVSAAQDAPDMIKLDWEEGTEGPIGDDGVGHTLFAYHNYDGYNRDYCPAYKFMAKHMCLPCRTTRQSELFSAWRKQNTRLVWNSVVHGLHDAPLNFVEDPVTKDCVNQEYTRVDQCPMRNNEPCFILGMFCKSYHAYMADGHLKRVTCEGDRKPWYDQ